MYERRIENSLHKTLRELERRQLIRQFQQQEAEQELPTKEPNHSAEKISDLKKQSQFIPGLTGAKSYMKGDYDNIPAGKIEENKAKQACLEPVEQIQFRALVSDKRVGEIEKSVATATD